MLVMTDLQRLARQRQLGMIDACEQHERFLRLADQGLFDGDDLRAIAAGASAIAILVRQRRATMPSQSSQVSYASHAGTGFQMMPALQWLLWSRDKVDHVRRFMGECQGDRTLRRLSEEAGIDVDGWQEALDNDSRDE